MIVRPHEDVEFPTLDGVTLRGWLFAAPQRGPAIIMSPGINCVKEMLLPEVASAFRAAGFTVLLYDNRSIGASDGLPRNDINPFKQTGDYHDAVSFIRDHPLVDPSRIALWGYSLSGMVALVATALDKRVAAVVACAPLTDIRVSPAKLTKILARVQKDRESCLAGNPPTQMPLLDKKGNSLFENAVPISPEQQELIRQAQSQSNDATSTQTYYHFALWNPRLLWPLVNPTPVMFCVAEKDEIALLERQKENFELFKEPGTFFVAANKGHMDLLGGEDFAENMAAQITFLKAYLGKAE